MTPRDDFAIDGSVPAGRPSPETAAVHDVAARGFATAGRAYETGRPEYPPEAIACLIDRLCIGPSSVVLDVGAGTGKLARLLLPTGARITGVEPVADMRDAFARALPGTAILEGTAEALPVADGSVDAIVVGTAFHWFDGVAALREARRVLRSGGGLGLAWNARDETVPWVAELVAMVATFMRGDPPRYTSGAWRAAFGTAPAPDWFTPLEEATFPFANVVPREVALARVASTSFVGALGEAERAEVLARARAMLDTHPDTRDRDGITLPHRADVFWCHRR